jgi:hypothetical protein
MHRITALLLFSVAGVAACSGDNPAEVSDSAGIFPVVAALDRDVCAHRAGHRHRCADVRSASGLSFRCHVQRQWSPNGVFQWRIFKRDCSVNVAAVNNTAPTGLVLFATTQSYPDITLDASGKATVKTTIAGWLDSLTAYSVRIRVTATTTFNGVNPAACGNLQYSAVK